MKYSIIVPVYNVEKYIEQCLNSIIKQTYDNYEVIIVNDGSPDNSMDIIKKFVKKDKRFKVFTKENGGLSDARNYGVKQSSGDAIIFVDGDDYIDKDLLLEIDKEFQVSRDIDVVRFQLRLVDDNGNVLEQPSYKVFSNISSKDAYRILLKDIYVDVACGYAYRKDFFIQNGFEYAKGKIHEDLGLTHLILIKSNNISSINYVGYNYVQREGSIMTSTSRKQNLRKVYDTLFHFDNYMAILKKDTSIIEGNKELLTNYLIRVIISKAKLLEDDDFNKYIKDLKKRRIYQYFPNDTMKDKIRRLVIKVLLKRYVIKNMNI